MKIIVSNKKESQLVIDLAKEAILYVVNNILKLEGKVSDKVYRFNVDAINNDIKSYHNAIIGLMLQSEADVLNEGQIKILCKEFNLGGVPNEIKIKIFSIIGYDNIKNEFIIKFNDMSIFFMNKFIKGDFYEKIENW